MESPTRTPGMEVVFLATDVARLFRKRFDTAARAFGVTGPQWRVLGNLKRRPGATQATLAADLDVEAITTGRMIDRLQKAGLVERRPDPADRRAWLLYLTPAGDELLQRLRGTVDEVMGEVLGGFAEGDVDQLIGLLTRLHGNMTTED
ncbi:MarR family winged helix-turn-helix transcriptional regulator [Novosphingobium sp.]|uniref:MarR family winged helix-turn-helix transcriptional regulator n=1 Tax=Novosphingobium sp. TaxID=1874826 RepID=UPI0026031113|nr:MarR family transcriptional regulator [Novosphingobium sp.]